MQKNRLRLNNLWVNTFVIDDDIMYFVSVWYNILFCMDMNTYTVYEAYNITKDSALSKNNVFYMYKKDKGIFLLIGKPKGEVLRFDIENKKIEYISNIEIDGNWGDNADEDEEYVYIPIINQKKIARMSKRDYTFECKDLPIEEKGVSTLCKDDNKFYVVTVGTARVIELNLKMEVLNVYENKPKGYKMIDSNYPSSGLFYLNNRVIVFPRYSNMSIICDTSNHKVLQLENSFENFDYGIGPIIAAAKKNGNEIIVYMNGLDEWFFYDLDMKCVKRMKMHINEHVTEKLENSRLFSGNCTYLETEKKEIHTLNQFIYSLVNG